MPMLPKLLGALILSPLAADLLGGEESARPPNVLLVLADDLGTLDLRCYGSRDLLTPHLDGLAREGVRFTRFYAASPVCSPSRAALLTGRHPARAGVPINVSSRPGKPGMPAEETTLAEVLKAAGYRTGLLGKWHLGTAPPCEPLDQGFDQFFGHKGGCIDNLSHFMYWDGPPHHDLWRDRAEHREDGSHLTALLVREAKRFLEENRERPFFLFLSLNIPHYPLQPPRQFLDLYPGTPEPRRSYAASVSALDAAVGEVLGKLDELGLEERTLVVFLSDHGHSTEERANHGGGNAGPYRGAKFSLFEGGIRVPCIARLPGRIPAGEARGAPCMNLDWLPTIAELCGAKLPERGVDGRSLAALLRAAGAPSPRDLLHFQFRDQWAVRQGDWKLIVNPSDTREGSRLEGADATFLVNLAEDPSESKNLAPLHSQVVAQLTALHQAWAKEVGAAAGIPPISAPGTPRDAPGPGAAHR